MSCVRDHHSSHIPSITLKKQNSVLTSRWRGATGRARGKLGNQMWSIKTYWHAKGLLLPHSHTWSINSYSKPRCLCGHMHMSPWLNKTHTCSCMSSQGNQQLASSRVCTVTPVRREMGYFSRNNTMLVWWLLTCIFLSVCKAKIYKLVLMHQRMDMKPISTWMAGLRGIRVFCFPPVGEQHLGGMESWGGG